jgi:hypothetical protein
MASKPSAIPVAVKYARIVSTPSQLGQEWRPRSHDAVTWETACWLFATEPFTQPEDVAGRDVPTCRPTGMRMPASPESGIPRLQKETPASGAGFGLKRQTVGQHQEGRQEPALSTSALRRR